MLKIRAVLFYGACLTLLASAGAYAQTSFEKIEVQKNGSYHIPVRGEGKARFYHFDLYSGKGDQRALRPLVINMHGGGFKIGGKGSASTPYFSRAYAHNGFLTASINYRKGKGRPLRNPEDLKKACFNAVEDLDKAIRYFKDHAAELRIDTNRIFLAGNSAGAMVALQYVYADSSGTRSSYIRGIANCWGAVYDSSWLSHARVPIVSVFGERDRVVPPGAGATGIYGSYVIHRQAEKLGIPNRYQAFSGRGHELHRHFNPLFAGPGARKKWKEAAAFICRFLNEQL